MSATSKIRCASDQISTIKMSPNATVYQGSWGYLSGFIGMWMEDGTALGDAVFLYQAKRVVAPMSTSAMTRGEVMYWNVTLACCVQSEANVVGPIGTLLEDKAAAATAEIDLRGDLAARTIGYHALVTS